VEERSRLWEGRVRLWRREEGCGDRVSLWRREAGCGGVE